LRENLTIVSLVFVNVLLWILTSIGL
jgi:hypothetical protein